MPRARIRSVSVRPVGVVLEDMEPRTLASGTPAEGAGGMGVNIESLVDWGRTYMFADAMKSARAFGSPNAPWNGAARVDADGWPVTDAGACVITIVIPRTGEQSVPDISGTYKFSATGYCKVNPVVSNAWVSNWAYDPATNTTTADVNVNKGADQLFLSFTQTRGGVKNIQLLRPGAHPGQVFTQDFLNAVAPFDTLRLMDLMRTNNNTVADWDKRAKPTDALQSSAKGVAWEYAVELANEAHKDLWINIPAHATDNYVTQLATLFKSSLDPSLHVYVEYSNEVWNSMFEQYSFNLAEARKAAAADPKLYRYDGTANPYFLAWRRIANRTVQIGDVFASVYGPGALNATVRPVLASQVAWTYVLRDQLDFLEYAYGDVNKHVYAVAGAPYIGLGDLSNAWGLTEDQVFPRLEQSITWNHGNVEKYTALATYYGLKHFFYEGGVALQGGAAFDSAKLPANYDPRMEAVVKDYVLKSFADGADMVAYYTLAGQHGTGGTWGLTENLADLSGPKYQGILDAAAAPRPAVTAGWRFDGAVTVPGQGFVSDRWGNNGAWAGDVASAGKGDVFDYLLNTSTADTYALTLTVRGSARLDLLVDGAPVATLTPAGGAFAALAPVTLPAFAAGLHTVRLKVVSGNVGIRSLALAPSAAPAPQPAPKPPAPYLFAPKALTSTQPAGTTDIVLAWDDVWNEAGYRVQRTTGGTWTTIADLPAGATTFTDTTAVARRTYTYRVVAYNGVTTSSLLTKVRLTVKPLPIVPATV